jgi:hypothetical protein
MKCILRKVHLTTLTVVSIHYAQDNHVPACSGVDHQNQIADCYGYASCRAFGGAPSCSPTTLQFYLVPNVPLGTYGAEALLCQ